MFPDQPARVIPNGIDLSVFRPADGQAAARRRLDIPLDADILLYTGHSPFKDVATVERAFEALDGRPRRRLLFVQLGVDGPEAPLGGGARIRTGFLRDPAVVADYYRAADVFVHAALAEAFGKTATESMACGTPVIASALGGLVEQIEHERTGLLVPPFDPEAIVAGVERLLADGGLRACIGHRAAEQARSGFGLERQARDFLNWYNEIVSLWRAHVREAGEKV